MSRFEPSGPLRGGFAPPPDKSISHRAALFGAMSDVPVAVTNYLDSADTRSTVDALLKLGAGVQEGTEPGSLTVRGVGLHAPLEATGGRLDVGNSGTLLRLLPGWLAGQPGGVWTLDGDESIRRRPVDRVVEPLRMMGAECQARDDRLPPLRVEGTELAGIEYEVPVASAQVKSCVLIAGMLAAGSTTITERTPEPRPYGANPAPFASAVRARRAQAHGLSGRRARARPDRRAGRPVLRGLHGRGRGAGAGLAGGGARRRPQLDADRFLPDRPPHGSGDRGRPRGAGHRGRRGAGRGARRGVRAAGGHERGAGRGAA